MKDLCVVLQQKERDILRVRLEIEALRAVIPLLSDEPGQSLAKGGASPADPPQKNKWPLEVREAR
ncbi:MAG TPA: hypothetical protein VMT28_06060 [Terriglobales bacterium]|jgi:hypothetical protein|nr:hypothetical protein [Terriglobales bacterium]